MTLQGLRVAIDCANGAAYKVAPLALWELGADVVTIGNAPNGTNINLECGSTHPDALQKKVHEVRADIGTHLVHLLLQRVGVRGTAFKIDVGAVRSIADGDNVGTQLPERERRNLVGSAIGAVDRDPEALQCHVARKCTLGLFYVCLLYTSPSPRD